MREGGIYFIESFKVTPNKAKYRSVHHDYMLTFTVATSVKTIIGENDKFKINKFEFVEFNDIQSRFQVDTYLTGIILIGVN